MKRDATARYEEQALTAWDLWSEGFSHYTVSNEDQYGPFRIGPAYPLTLGTHQPLPAESYAYFGDAIVATPYQPQDQGRATLGQLRYPCEIQELSIMQAKVLEGSETFQMLSEALTGWRAEEMGYLANMGGFIAACCATAIHAKQWYMAYTGLQASKSREEIRARVEEMRQIAQREIQNVENAKQYIESDSRLGWEPSMEYMADARRLDWKIKATELTVKSLTMYTDSLQFS